MRRLTVQIVKVDSRIYWTIGHGGQLFTDNNEGVTSDKTKSHQDERWA
jgi:hypothetical protein